MKVLSLQSQAWYPKKTGVWNDPKVYKSTAIDFARQLIQVLDDNDMKNPAPVVIPVLVRDRVKETVRVESINFDTTSLVKVAKSEDEGRYIMSSLKYSTDDMEFLGFTTVSFIRVVFSSWYKQRQLEAKVRKPLFGKKPKSMCASTLAENIINENTGRLNIHTKG